MLKALKEDAATASTPVMMMSSLLQKNSEQLGKDGAHSFYEKSDSMLGNGPDSLVDRANRILKKR